MGIGRILSDKKGKEIFEMPKEVSKCSKKNRRRQKKQPSPVQKLFETCKEVFALGGIGVVPPAQCIDKLRSVLDSLKPADLGLTPDMPYFRKSVTGKPPVITYLHLYECDQFSIGIFCLPPSGVIPLHNHPGMTVFSKLLLGSMHIKSFDWTAPAPSNSAVTSSSSADSSSKSPVSPSKSPVSPSKSVDEPKSPAVSPDASVHSQVRLAKVKMDTAFTAPCSTSILYPDSGGNMHCFSALTACAVLDVLGPPYSDPDGRHCQYYLDFPFSKLSDEEVSVPDEERELHAWLQEIEKPEDLAVVGAVYRGPGIVDK